MNGEDGKQSRTQLTAADRKVNCEFHQEHPSYSHAQITEVASKQLNKQLARSTVFKTLQKSEQWLTSTVQEGGRKRQRKAKYEDLEKELLPFSQQLQAQDGRWSDSRLRSEAKRLAGLMALTEFRASNGWLDSFKKRHHIKSKGIPGESAVAAPAGAANDAGIDIARAAVPEMVADGECGVREPDNGPADTDSSAFATQPRVSHAAAKDAIQTITAYLSEQPSLPPEAQLDMQRLASMVAKHRALCLIGQAQLRSLIVSGLEQSPTTV